MIAFREKSLWVSLLITVVIATIYGDNIYYFLKAGQSADPQAVAALITRVVIAFIVLEVVLHIALAMGEQENANLPEDERERNYRLLANNIGYWVLSIGVIGCVLQQMANSYIEAQASYPAFLSSPIELKLVVVFWVSEAVRFATEIYYYRKES
ncbi:hypothetical protein DRW07_10400 [Alteromonas sediminis]|uniref:Uncharacterized protein n=1 Tax=Alteromonas sediminis TaxID=2259342 RepID=A0A3N5Y1Q6_9ALTE|nr:hypothetical protein [Alteromonas sediminis]RPJ66496.1 hypothetical protein DRW07_10400 [Alteromonas sediminis]